MSFKNINGNYLYILAIFFILFFTSCTTPVSEKKENEPNPVVYFKITFDTKMSSGKLSPDEINGESAILSMDDDEVYYERFRIEFTGDTYSLPDNIEVKVTWENREEYRFRWSSSVNDSDTSTYNVPKSGGTIGINGTVHNSSGCFCPDIGPETGNPIPDPLSGTIGTVKFEANLVRTLNLTIVR